MSSAMVFHSWPFVPAISKSRLTLSFHRIFGLPLLLLPLSSASHALFDIMSSLILCTCPAHPILLPSIFSFRCFFSFQSLLSIPYIFLLYSWGTLHILRTQLFYATCVLSSFLSVSASVPNSYIQAGTTQASNTFPFSCFFSFLSHIMPSTLLLTYSQKIPSILFITVTVRYHFREEFTIVVSGHLYAASRSRGCVDCLSMPEVLRSIRTTESFNVEVLPRKALWDRL